MKRIEIYDTTLRDGTQGEGIAFSLVDKLKITEKLDALGVDFIEGGYPLSNPKDIAYFKEVGQLRLANARVAAFGMTRRRGVRAADDPGMQALVAAAASVITIVGKTWDLHVTEVLRAELDENLEMIRDSLAHGAASGAEVIYDAEHFFDGYRANGAYALRTLEAALRGGATCLVLCDTNGGSLPDWIGQVVDQVRDAIGKDTALGIHTHNDGGLAVADALRAVEHGCRHVQGTVNGYGERCGNADLTTLVANLSLKMDYRCLAPDAIGRLTETSRYVHELANLNPPAAQPFVGPSAFAHKGGMHVHAVQRVPQSYEHVDPRTIGNARRVLVSELSGVSNIEVLGEKFDLGSDRAVQRRVLERVQELEHRGYQFESATASFELLVYDALRQRPRYWSFDHYRCVILKSGTDSPVTEAIVKLGVGDGIEHCVADGDGPVNALDGAIRKCLAPYYPLIGNLHLADYRVRVVNPTAESAAKVRVVAEFRVVGEGIPHRVFATVGVDENIVDASWQALTDAFEYHLIESAIAPR